jgi:hypothetical protein
MHLYRFSVHDAVGDEREVIGQMSFLNDTAALVFGQRVIKDILRGTKCYSGWTMDIATRDRSVCSIAFPQNQAEGLVGRKHPESV